MELCGEVLERGLGDAEAALLERDDQIVGGQLAERFADGARADAEARLHLADLD